MEKLDFELEIGTQYLISNRYKKTVVEVEMFSGKDLKGLNVDVHWRAGAFYVTPQNQDEIDLLMRCYNEDDEFDTDSFEEWEMDHTWDGVWEYFSYYPQWSDEEQEAFDTEYEEYDDYRYEFLTEKGYDSEGCIYYIEGGVDISLIETHE